MTKPNQETLIMYNKQQLIESESEVCFKRPPLCRLSC